MKKGKEKVIPFDCLGRILLFNSSKKVLHKMMLLSKKTKNYVEKENPDCVRNMKFKIKKNPKKEIPYVRQLVGKDLYGKNKINFSLFPNVFKLRVTNCEMARAFDNNNLQKISYMELINPRGIKSIKGLVGKDLKVLDVDFSHKNTYPKLLSRHLKTFKNLKKLTLCCCNINSLNFLSEMKDLRVLRLLGVHADKDANMDLVEKTPKIYRLHLENTNALFGLKNTFKGWMKMKKVDLIKLSFISSEEKNLFVDSAKVKIVERKAKRGSVRYVPPTVKRLKF